MRLLLRTSHRVWRSKNRLLPAFQSPLHVKCLVESHKQHPETFVFITPMAIFDLFHLNDKYWMLIGVSECFLVPFSEARSCTFFLALQLGAAISTVGIFLLRNKIGRARFTKYGEALILKHLKVENVVNTR